MSITFSTIDGCAFTFYNNLKIRIIEMPDSYTNAYIDSLKNIIDKIDGSKYNIKIDNNWNLVIQVIYNNIKFSVCNDSLMYNSENIYLKPFVEISVLYDDCIDAIKVFHNQIIQNIENIMNDNYDDNYDETYDEHYDDTYDENENDN